MVLTDLYAAIMYLLHGWARVGRWLLPHNVKLFTLVTLKTIGMTYIELYKIFWQLLLLVTSCLVLVSLEAVWHMLLFVLVFTYYLLARPSIDQKTFSYLIGYTPQFLWVCLSVLIMISIGYGDLESFFITRVSHDIWWTYLYYVPYSVFYMLYGAVKLPLLCARPLVSFSALEHSYPFFLILFLYPFTSFFILFLLDSRPTFSAVLKSLYRAFVMQWFTLPFTFPVTYLVFGCYHGLYFYVFSYVISKCSGFFSDYLLLQGTALLSILAMPLFISLWTNVYIKHVHDEFSLYCRQQC